METQKKREINYRGSYLQLLDCSFFITPPGRLDDGCCSVKCKNKSKEVARLNSNIYYRNQDCMGGTHVLFSLEIHCAVVNGYKMNILMEILVMNCNTYEKVRSFCLEAKKGDQWKT